MLQQLLKVSHDQTVLSLSVQTGNMSGSKKFVFKVKQSHQLILRMAITF